MNKKRVKTFRLWAVAATVGSLLALNAGHLHAENVTYKPGFLLKAGQPQTDAVAAGNLTLADKGFAIRGHVQLGWSTRRVPVVRNQAAEAGVQPLYRIGDTFALTQDTTLYAVWAVDANNNGRRDYTENGENLRMTESFRERLREQLRREREEAENRRRKPGSVSLRSLPAYNINNDILAYDSAIYMVGCRFNTDTGRFITEPLIRFSPNWSFDRDSLHKIKTLNSLELVFEYGGVLEDSCLTGGKAQKPITRIPFPNDGTTTAADLFSFDPMMFTRIQKDGDAVLKLYFVRAGSNTLADASDWDVSGTANWKLSPTSYFPKPFLDLRTGTPTDTMTVRFRIYNPAKFKSDVLNQILLYKDSVDFGHVSGMPMKYMVRSFDNGFTWHPAEAPLSEVEKDLVEDSARVCLRELDKAIGYAAYQKMAYLDPEEFNYDYHSTSGNVTLANEFRNEMQTQYYDSLYQRLPLLEKNQLCVDLGYSDSNDPLWTNKSKEDQMNEISTLLQYSWTWDPSDPSQGAAYDYFRDILKYTDIKGLAEIEVLTRGGWNTVVGARLADKVGVPDRCRPDHCFYFGTLAPPVLNRQVFIPEVEGATVMPGYGNFYVPSQNDFRFTVKYAGKPMEVTTNRTVDGKPEVLVGSLNANGEYEYLIRRVTQEIRLTFTADVSASTVADATVWAAGGAIRIHAAKAEAVSVYSAAGRLVKRLTLSAGDTMIPVERGLYLVVFADGTSHKVAVR